MKYVSKPLLIYGFLIGLVLAFANFWIFQTIYSLETGDTSIKQSESINTNDFICDGLSLSFPEGKKNAQIKAGYPFFERFSYEYDYYKPRPCVSGTFNMFKPSATDLIKERSFYMNFAVYFFSAIVLLHIVYVAIPAAIRNSKKPKSRENTRD